MNPLGFGFYNMDCMEGMKQFPDKYFDLAVVDPPYGGGAKADAEETFKGTVQGRFGGHFEKYIKAERVGGGRYKKYGKVIANWDIAPQQEYFEELFRVSKNQIIWGGELLRTTSDKMLPSMEKDKHPGKLFNGYVRICLDEL